ncbi:MAG: membrane protein insertion efficiency factor YidD [bacterium]
MRRIIRLLFFLYRKLKFGAPACRYFPSCSHYTEEAIEKHGLTYGGFLALKRIIKCNQFFIGGLDPVP